MKLFIFGYGFSAETLARRLRAHEWQIAATCRSEEKAERLRAEGIEAHVFDGETPMAEACRPLESATHLLSSIPPGKNGDPVLKHHANDIRACGPYEWIGYLSTTGVYGNRDGGWVDETSPLTPTGERGQRRVDAEKGWFALGDCGPVMSFRLAGIYGPGRNALETVRQGRAKRIVKPGQVFSRIHVEDIANVLEASIGRPNAGAAYNVCDDDPAPPQDLITLACEMLGREPPPEVPFDEAELSEMARSFYRDNKRVSNRRIKDELGVRLSYPDYRAGLRALFVSFRTN